MVVVAGIFLDVGVSGFLRAVAASDRLDLGLSGYGWLPVRWVSWESCSWRHEPELLALGFVLMTLSDSSRLAAIAVFLAGARGAFVGFLSWWNLLTCSQNSELHRAQVGGVGPAFQVACFGLVPVGENQ